MRLLLITLFVFRMVAGSFAEENEKNHKVKRGETVYSISKLYNITPEKLAKANPKVEKKMKVHVGQKLVIPIEIQVIHVAPLEPIKMKIEKINPPAKTDNPVVDKAVSVASVVKLKTSSGNPGEYSSIFGSYASGGFKLSKVRGAANFLDNNTSGNAHLAFYNSAEVGSIVRVTNMMNKKTVYVKVVGKLPPVEVSRDIVIKFTKKLASQLGAVDEKFLVEVTGYSEPPPTPVSTKGTTPKK